MTPKPDERSAPFDPLVADAWREASAEDPPASVDEAILAAARREVSARPETLAAWEAREVRASRRRWWPLAAAATVAAIAVGVLQLTPDEKLGHSATETATVSDMPAPAAKSDAGAPAQPPAQSAPATAPAAPQPAPQRVAPASQPKEDKRARSDNARSKVEAKRAEPRPQPASPAAVADPFPAAKKTGADTAVAGGQVAASPPPAAQAPRAEVAANVAQESDSGARQPNAPAPMPAERAPAAAPRPAPAGAPLAKLAAAPTADSAFAEPRAKDRKPLPVADWIALIRRLRTEGKTDDAAKELAAFRAAHPDHEKLLPPDLRDWRPPVK